MKIVIINTNDTIAAMDSTPSHMHNDLIYTHGTFLWQIQYILSHNLMKIQHQ